MTTKHSPLGALKVQAAKIATTLKAAERGDRIDVRFAERIAEARTKSGIKIGVVMDDKVITFEIPWATIRASSETAIAEYIVKYMQEKHNAPN
jgi:hypothetical protein